MTKQDYKKQIEKWNNEDIQNAIKTIVNDKENHIDSNYKKAIWEIAQERWS